MPDDGYVGATFTAETYPALAQLRIEHPDLLAKLLEQICDQYAFKFHIVAAATPPGDVPEVVAPKLEHADGAVIIRRNDTLWRISRRVYGHGVRYSTIYLANQDQIRDPDRIWPGQVFKVPQKSKEGEAADLKAMGEQATTAPAKTK